MAWLATFRILFILYCIEAGVFLLLSPWSPRWEQSLIQLSATSWTLLLLHPAVRGAISGFGLVHLIWGAHDLDLWLAGRRRGVVATAASEPAGPVPAAEAEALVSEEP